MTFEEFEKLTERVVSDIEGQNWTNTPLSEREKQLIWMAVRSTAAALSSTQDREP